MRSLVLLLAAPLCCGCAGARDATVPYPADRETAIAVAGTMLGRLDAAPRLEEENGQPVVRSALGEVRFAVVSSNLTAVRISAPRADVLVGLYPESARLEGMPLASGGKSLLLLAGLHLISPGISGIYSARDNLFAAAASPWGRLFGHLGIDGALVVLAGSRAFTRDIRFDGAVVGALLLHRLVTIPGLVIETDLGNRAFRAGYGLRF